MLREPRIPVQMKAFMDGIVVDVIEKEGVVVENKSAYIQGIFGIGGEVYSELKMVSKSPDEIVEPSSIDESCKGKIIVCGSLVPYAVIQKAVEKVY